MAISPYDLEQKFEHELDLLEGEIDEYLSKFSINKGGTIIIPTPKNFKTQHKEQIIYRYLEVGWASVRWINDQKDGSYLEFIF